MDKQKQLILLILALCSLHVSLVEAQQLIDNCAQHQDVLDFYQPTSWRKICVRCQSTSTDLYVLRYDFQECIKTVNFVDGFQNCQQLTIDGKCKQTLSNSTIVNSDTWTIVNRTSTVSGFCAQINNQGSCIFPNYPISLYTGQSQQANYQNPYEFLGCAFRDETKCVKSHYGIIYLSNSPFIYFLFDFQNYDKLKTTILSSTNDKLFCVSGYTFTQSGCIQNGSSFPTIPNCAEQMGDYCYTCNSGYTLQNTRQTCSKIGNGCLTYEVIRGVSQCTLCDTSVPGQYSLYKGACYTNIAQSHPYIRFGSFCVAPYYSQFCQQVASNLPQNCQIVDSVKGTCAQCQDVESVYYDVKSNTCKNRVYSLDCAMKHPISDSCYVPYCKPGLRYRFPLPTFYPPVYTYIDGKYTGIWINQFLSAKNNVTQNECIPNISNPLDPNCQTYDQFGQSCTLCKPNYWLLAKTDGTNYFNCSSDLTKFNNNINNCLVFDNYRSRCITCKSGYISNSNGYCVTDDNSYCLSYDINGNCLLCKDGYYPFQKGCSNMDLCWLKCDPNTNNCICADCRKSFKNNIIRSKDVCLSAYDTCFLKNSSGGNCQECQPGYTLFAYYDPRNQQYTYSCSAIDTYLKAWYYYATINTYEKKYTSKPGWDYSGQITQYSNSNVITCQNGYVNLQCDSCSSNCQSCIDNMCYTCQSGYTLNKSFECVANKQ
ncbi:hypothetical protein ABPG74_008997 [Tetrahymena malaccensis]